MGNQITIATWNVNSIRARLDNVQKWLETHKPDIVCLQEIKATTDNFPFLEIEACGYHATIVGQKSYNGVAILTKGAKPDNISYKYLPSKAPPQFEDGETPQARYIEIDHKGVKVASIYLPNGNPIDTEKFDYKLEWMERLHDHAKSSLLHLLKPVILCGDFNVIPRDVDCYSPGEWRRDALFHPKTINAFQKIKNLGFYDAFESLYPNVDQPYTFWDYQGGAWQKNNGIRIDHFLLNPKAMDKLVSCNINKEERGTEKASDHVPVILTLDL